MEHYTLAAQEIGDAQSELAWLGTLGSIFGQMGIASRRGVTTRRR